MRHRPTIVLFVLFVAGLGVLWWADYAKVPDRNKQRELVNRLLPELIDTPTAEIRRIEIEPGPGGKDRARIVVERGEGGAWQLKSPVDTAADANLVETLARNLKDLRKSSDAGTILEDPAGYGLDRPEATVTLYGSGKGGSAGAPLATLDVGKTDGRRTYVRPGGGPGIEVVDAVLLEPLHQPAVKWRDTALFHLPSFRVASVAVREPKADRDIELKRDERHWRISKPIQVPAEDDKAEGLVAELSALRVTDGRDGFVKDDAGAAERARYGLDASSMTITMTPFPGGGKPQVLTLGAEVPGHPDQAYAVRGDQDEIVRVDVKRLREAIPGVNGLRSQKVLDFIPQRVNRVRIDARDKVFDLALTTKGWELLGPDRVKAETALVRSLLMRLADLKTSEFLDPAAVAQPRLDPPAFRIRGWQPDPGEPSPLGEPTPEVPTAKPRFDLAVGRRDLARKTVYGRIAGDTTVLALPDSIVAELPANDFAYRDLIVNDFSPQNVARVTVERGGSSVTVEAPGSKGAANQWVMVAPVKARADNQAVTQMIVTLASLRAANWESDHVANATTYGFDRPSMRVKWTLGSGEEKALRVGKTRPNSGGFYANIEDESPVFTIHPAVLAVFEAELHDRTVLRFKPETVERLVVQWPSRTVTLNRNQRKGESTAEWLPAVPFDQPDFDPARAAAVVAAMADLKTTRFQQYDGPIPDAAGLDHPRLTVRVKVEGEAGERVLRVGNSLPADSFAATTAPGDRGPVFALPATAPWKELLQPPHRPDDLPDNPFAAP